MDFCVLGPLEVRDRGQVLALGGPRQRAVLAFLLLHANEVVSAERLLEAAWGEQPPPTGQAGLHVRISQLRKALGAARIETRPPGYVLSVKPGELDLERFEQLASEGRRALIAGDPEHAANVLAKALGLWRGPPLGDVTFEPVAIREVARLDELRWAALETRIEAQLELGRPTSSSGNSRRSSASSRCGSGSVSTGCWPCTGRGARRRRLPLTARHGARGSRASGSSPAGVCSGSSTRCSFRTLARASERSSG
jgi:DNA-binding SARP family transcriptional activator